METIRVPTIRQGQTGRGQGGYTSQRFAEAIGESVTVALRNPIPLETDLDIVYHEDSWRLVDPSDPATVILEATRWEPSFASTSPVTIDDAAAARQGFPLSIDDHPAPHCLSCGFGEHSLRVHAGSLGDGRWATPFRAPARSAPDGVFDMSLLWMAMDCSSAWYISHSSPDERQSVTVQFAVQAHRPIETETDYALVAWNGDYPPEWDGRKRGAAAALFDADGACVAQSRSFWVAV